MKACRDCKENKSLTEYYSQEKHSKKRGSYIYFQPYCKECSIKRSQNWQGNNEDRYRELCKKKDDIWNKNPEKLKRMRELAKLQRESGYMDKWRKSNPEKIKGYNFNHMNKTHKITNLEWEACKTYFNNSCAYCGIEEVVAKKIQGQNLHREHAINNGSEFLDNCIPSCKSCNCHKWKRDYTDWYNETLIQFNTDKLIKIKKWLEEDYKLFIEKEE